ncbi:beta-ketoacyl synthase N-terminal-like domain-containing protein [Candidatus Riflebacteria bacterium]
MEAIAITGMSCIFPQARDRDSFWKNIVAGKDATRRISNDRFGLNVDEFIDKPGIRDSMYSANCGYIDYQVDLSPFKNHAMEVDLHKLDPYYQWLLYLSYQALKDAGFSDPLAMGHNDSLFSRTGLVLATLTFALEKAEENGEDTIKNALIKHLANLLNLPAPQLPTPTPEDYYNTHQSALPASFTSDIFRFGVPSFALDAACASSLYAIYYACEKLRSHDADMFLAAGVNRSEMAALLIGFCQLSALSKNGVCRPFDKNADGLLVGEGGGVLVLKRLSDALQNGDRIHALIRHTSLSCDGRGTGLLSPSQPGQVDALQKAYTATEICPSSIDLVECHGTATPKGDSTEIATIKEVFSPSANKRDNACAIGSIKSMVGHCLSAAGMAGVFKTIMAIQNKTLPPSLCENVSTHIGLEDSPFYVQTTAQPWKDRKDGEPRRAGISAFGFGGTNAHTILEEFNARKPPAYRSTARGEREEIAIIAMACEFGGVGELAEFWDRCVRGSEAFFKLPANRWPDFDYDLYFKEIPKGLFLDLIHIDLKKFRMTPSQFQKLLPQQLLITKVARQCLGGAGLLHKLSGSNRVGALIGLNWMAAIAENTIRLKTPRMIKKITSELKLELNAENQKIWLDTLRNAISLPVDSESVLGDIPNFPANRLSSEFDFRGPSHVIFQEEGSGLKALELGIEALERKDVDYMLIGAVDLPGDFKSLLAEKGLDAELISIKPAEAAIAIVIQRLKDARKENHSIHAIIKDIGGKKFQQQNLNRESLAFAQQLLQKVPEVKSQYMEIASQQFSEEELLDYAEIFPGHLLSLPESYGALRSCAGLTSLMRAVCALRERIIPLRENAISKRRDDKAAPWLLESSKNQRTALIFQRCRDGNCNYLLLQEPEQAGKKSDTKFQSLFAPGKSLFLLREKNRSTLQAKIKDAVTALKTEDFQNLIVENLDAFAKNRLKKSNSLALIVKDKKDLQEKLLRAETYLNSGVEEINDPGGIFFQAKPLGEKGKVAAVYPGFGNIYHGMGRQLALMFPHLLENFQNRSNFIGKISSAAKLWHEKEVDPFTLDTAEITLATTFNSCLYTDLFFNDFKIPFATVIGHSGGEINCLSALKVWDIDSYFEKEAFRTLFNNEFAGEFKSVQKYFNSNEPIEWHSYLVFAPEEEVKKHLQNQDKVFLTMVNSKEECMVAGVAAQLKSFLAGIGAEHRRIPIPQVYHCPILKLHESGLKKLWSNNCTVPENLIFYSHSAGKPYSVSRKNCAETITRTACEAVNFIPVIEHAYNNDVRIFIELGPQNSVCRYIQSILKGKEFFAISANTRERDEYSQLLFTLAQLATHGISFNPRILKSQLKKEGELTDEKDVAFPISLNAGRVLGKADFAAIANTLCDNIQKHEKIIEPPAKVIPLKRTKMKSPLLKKEVGETEVKRQKSNIGATHSLESDSVNAYLKLQSRISEVHQHFLRQQQHFMQFSEALQRGDVFPELPELQRHIPELQQFVPAAPQAFTQEVIRPQRPTKQIPVPENDRTPKDKFIDRLPRAVLFNKEQIYAFAKGNLQDVFGPDFAEIDSFKFRTRFPDDPYLFVDRVSYLKGEPKELKPATVVTEFDVRPDHWFLENGRVPIAVSIESGQADLFLISYLGIDIKVEGARVYRLLGCDLTYYNDLPAPPCTLKYEISINSFVKHEGVYLFYFNGYGYVNGHLFIKWENGCAGYFTYEELAEKKIYVFPEVEKRRTPSSYVPVRKAQGWNYTHEQLLALTRGDYAACFGEGYIVPLPTERTVKLANEKILFLHRVTMVDPKGGPWGSGHLEAEIDLFDDAWYFNCHFPTDPVLAGTLILDGCTQLIEFYMMYLGFGFQFPGGFFQPIRHEEMKIKCRGQVIPGNRVMQYFLDIKSFEPGCRPRIYADVLVLSDGKEVVKVDNLAYELFCPELPELPPAGEQAFDKYGREVVVNKSQIIELTMGNPSRYFGEHYKDFDSKRQLSRMPNIPYGTIDRVHSLEGEKRKIKAGVSMTCEMDFSEDEWFFQLNHGLMPYCIMNEVALQPCGLIAQLLELDMLSKNDRFIRNLNGHMRQLHDIYAHTGSIMARVVMKEVVDMQQMFMVTLDGQYFLPDGTVVAEGYDLKFGFGTKESLAQAPGLKFPKEEKMKLEGQNAIARKSFSGPIIPLQEVGREVKMPLYPLNFLDEIVEFLPTGGRWGKGYVKAIKKVNPHEWIFYSHFYMDPVVPGSYSLEAMGQLLEYFMLAENMDVQLTQPAHFRMAYDEMFNWGYRGQILQNNIEIVYEAEIKERIDGENPFVIGDGRVYTDGKYIYELFDLKVGIVPYPFFK